MALEKLPSKVAAVVPREQLAQAISAAGLPAKGARFVNHAELAALEALQVAHPSLSVPAHVQICRLRTISLSDTSDFAEMWAGFCNAGSHIVFALCPVIKP